MKKTNKYLAIACTGVLAIAGCQKPEMEDAANAAGQTTVIEATLSDEGIESKTQMTPGADADTYKVEWQAGDAVQMNGNPSTAIAIKEDASNASFTFEGASFDAPYYAVYPAAAATAFADAAYTLSLPKTQTYVGSDKFSPEASLMLGYSAESGKVAFRHAMAYIRLTLSAGDAPVRSVTFESNNQEAMAGTFKATCTDGAWTLAKETGSVYAVDLVCEGEGAAIGDKMLVAIPAGTYAEGFRIVVKDTQSHYMVKKSTAEFVAEAGGIYDMSFDFVSQGTVVEGDIYTVSDWTAFAKSVAGGNTYEGQTITLKSDLSVDTYFEYANGTFEGTFDGNGKTMTANGNIWPLFTTIGENGIVRNLTIDGKFSRYANAAEVGNATIAKINKGLIQDVTNYADTELSGTYVFGHIVTQNGGKLERCKNYGNMTLTYTATGASGLYGGGLAAIGHTVSGAPDATVINVDETCTPGQFIDCENHGTITITATAGKPVRQGFGGICGVVYLNGVKFDGCKNYGAISRISNGEASNNFSASIGGILGRSAAWFTTGAGDSGAFDDGMTDSGTETGIGFDTEYNTCTNEGTLYCTCRHSGALTYNGRVRRSDNVGGIVGLAVGANGKKQNLIGCINTGTLTGGWSHDTNAASLGGIAGYATYTDISNCSSICSFASIDNTKAIGAAGGLVGYVVKEVTIKDNCTSVPTMDIYGKNTTNFLYGLVIGNINIGASIESVAVAGSIKAGVAKQTQTDLGITSENYTGYLISANSNVKISSPVTTWYTPAN